MKAVLKMNAVLLAATALMNMSASALADPIRVGVRFTPGPLHACIDLGDAQDIARYATQHDGDAYDGFLQKSAQGLCGLVPPGADLAVLVEIVGSFPDRANLQTGKRYIVEVRLLNQAEEYVTIYALLVTQRVATGLAA